jgi:acetyl esterase/lipase
MPGPARILRDVCARTERHRYGPHRQHRADLWVPRGHGPHPVVVLIHGGFWHARYGKVVMKPLAAELVRRGFATWNIEYRRMGRGQGGGYPDTFDDVAAAIDQLAELEDSRLDLERVMFIGHSAGGQLAIWAASRADSPVRPVLVVAQAAVWDMSTAGPIARRFMGGWPEQVPERYDACDPMRLVPLGVPTVVIHTPGDNTIPLQRARMYAEAAREAGDDVELLEPPGGHRAHIDPRAQPCRLAIDALERAAKQVRA